MPLIAYEVSGADAVGDGCASRTDVSVRATEFVNIGTCGGIFYSNQIILHVINNERRAAHRHHAQAGVYDCSAEVGD